MELHLKIVGFIFIAISFLHIGFPTRFKWKEELQSLSLINKQLMLIHTFFIALAVLLIGILCLIATHDLVNTTLGKQICFGLFIFWIIRLFFQLFVYSTKLWKGKLFETVMHGVFSIIWTYASILFLWICTSN